MVDRLAPTNYSRVITTVLEGFFFHSCLSFEFQYGDTPLHTAARYGHAGVARILISASTNPNLQNKVRELSSSQNNVLNFLSLLLEITI
jgi:ankyrin repeat protein